MAETSYNFAYQLLGDPDELGEVPASEAWAHYRAAYWEPLNADALPQGVDIAAFLLAPEHGVDAVKKAVAATKKLDAVARVNALCDKFSARHDQRQNALDMTLAETR